MTPVTRVRAKTPAFDRVMRRTRRDGDCLIFIGHIAKTGYGMVGDRSPEGKKISRLAHVVVAEHELGPKPNPKAQVMHTCPNSACVEPTHIQWASRSDVVQGMIARGTHSAPPIARPRDTPILLRPDLRRADGLSYIPLARGGVAVIDQADEHLVARHNWREQPTRHTVYAITKIRGKTIGMHRLILPLPDGQEVDHINWDGLDNRRENLRAATGSLNGANKRKGSRTDGTSFSSQYKGVRWSDKHQCWIAAIGTKDADGVRKVKHLGCFHDEQLAARAYDAVAVAQWGEFAHTNFPTGDFQ